MLLRNGKIIGNITCSCGNICDLLKNNKKCCYCSDIRSYKPMITFRGDGIVYNHFSWAYCPKCQKFDKCYTEL